MSNDEKKSDEELAGSQPHGEEGSELEKSSEGLELLDRLPADARKVVEMGMSIHRFGPMPNPLTEKLTESHIDKMLEMSSKGNERAFEDSKASRRYTLVYVLLAIALFVFLTIYLVDVDQALWLEILKLLAVFVGGFGGGFGVKSYFSRNR